MMINQEEIMKNLVTQTDHKDASRKVRLSVEMTADDVERALELQRIALAFGRRNGRRNSQQQHQSKANDI